jgi:hypothetical protein
MNETEEDGEIDDLLFIAETLSDKLAVVSYAHSLKFIAIVGGLNSAIICIAGLSYLVFGRSVPNFRFADGLYQLAPVLLLAVIYITARLCVAFYRVSLDRTYLRLVRKRLDAAIGDAHNLEQP